MKRYDIGDKVVARDGGALTIIKVDKRNAELPQMSRYTVQQADGDRKSVV